MGAINYHITQNSVTLNFEGKTLSVARGDDRFAKVIQAIKEGRLADIPALVDVNAAFEGTGLSIVNGVIVTQTGEQLPSELNARVLDFKREGLPFEHLLKFWDNLKLNPSYRSREQLFKFLEQNGHPLTEDGCFIAYRGVTSDFKDVHTGTFDNRPGSVCEMPRTQVDDDPTRTCSAGLHVAAWDYASGFGPVKVEVKVNPSDVVAVPTDYNGQKMRVCRFEVVQQCQNARTNESLYGHQDLYRVTDAGEIKWFDEESEIDPTEDTATVALVVDAFHKFQDRYEGDGLIARISEETYESESDIVAILDNEGLL